MQANIVRNEILESTRRSLSRVALAVSQRLKPVGKSFSLLCEEKAARLFDRPFDGLARSQKVAVFEAIIEGSGHTNRIVTAASRVASGLGRGMVASTLLIEAYHVVTANDRLDAVGESGASFAGLHFGAAAGMAVGGLACATMPYVCIPLAAFLGGMAGSTLGRETYRYYRDWMLR